MGGYHFLDLVQVANKSIRKVQTLRLQLFSSNIYRTLEKADDLSFTNLNIIENAENKSQLPSKKLTFYVSVTSNQTYCVLLTSNGFLALTAQSIACLLLTHIQLIKKQEEKKIK
jgi:hypothetical protein